MNTIVFNPLARAVTEYTGFGFHAITPNYAGGVTGLYKLGGDTDAGEPIVAEAITGLKQWGDSHRKFVKMVFFGIEGPSRGKLIVNVDGQRYDYPVTRHCERECRALPGRGIRASYLAIGYTNTDGKDFQIDRIEADIQPFTSRRT